MHWYNRLISAAALLFPVSLAQAAEPTASWPVVTLAPAREVKLSGPLGDSLRRGVARLAKPPYTEPWLRADVSFETNRIFTNYSGDVSGRFLELASLTSLPGQFSPPPLSALAKTVSQFQKADGHFGVAVDLNQPLPRNSAPIPMLWGNARLLVGLLTAADRLHNAQLLASARRLGDFYVNSADQLCSPNREVDYRSSGTGGDGYTCCYFPAIEGLAMLYRQTKDDRYLKQAERMATFFMKFDCLPIDHSHGNLCAWRGILQLYEITGNRTYLDRARTKWNAAMNGGFVWPLGGVGEHWHVSFQGDEGCSESDWLRFNLDLWCFTGETNYLDVAERLLENQYATNQCPNSGYGMARVDSDAAGPVAALEKIEEWPFCCSFHGPLGLHFLKGYLAVGCDRGVLINFLLDFSAPVKAAGREWSVSVHSRPDYGQGRAHMEIEMEPRDKAAVAHSTLWVRVPGWASDATVATGSGDHVQAISKGGYLQIERDFKAGDKLMVDFQVKLALEGRRFQKVQVAAGTISRVKDVAILAGPDLLYAVPVKTGGRPVLLATVDENGWLSFPASGAGEFATVNLPSIDATETQITEAIGAARPIVLRTWPAIVASRHGNPAFVSAVDMSDLGRSGGLRARRLPFMFDLVVVPAAALGSEAASLASRVKTMESEQAAAIFGDNLEKRSEIWSADSGWKFTSQGLLVSGGDIGLLDGEGYGDYRLTFDLVVPKEGQGITGWVVRAKDANDCLMFQLQTADSTYHAPEFKTRPNTLRPHRRTGGQWQIAEPVPLPKPIRTGELHQIVTECRQDRIDILVDGQPVYHQSGVDLRGGTIGFRANGPVEQGLFRAISLQKL